MIIAERLSREIDHNVGESLLGGGHGAPVHTVCIFLRNHLSLTGMRPYIAEELCNRCGECVDTCPYEVFGEEADRVVVAVPEDCIECTSCLDSCLAKAISMGD
jgi:NAD-dependent dihydropyrimidine dehydrogenase PreA subunit